MQLLSHSSHFSTLVSKGMILTVRCTEGDVDSANRFCVRKIQTADMKWPSMSDSRGRYCQSVSDSTSYMSVGLSFGESKVLFEIKHLRRIT